MTTNYSSPDEASSDDEISDWTDFSEEEQGAAVEVDERQVIALGPGRPKKLKSPIEPPTSLELVRGKRKRNNGNDSFLVVFQGEVYQRSGQIDAMGIQQWRCVKNSEGCKMVIESNARNMCVSRSEGQHSHCTSKVDLDLRKIKAQIPSLATRDQKSDGDPKISPRPEVMVIPYELQQYKNNLFVVYDSGPSARRVIIFSTPALLSFLEQSEWWGFDGTFALVPKGWRQLMSLHAKQGETFIPCLHALLPKKSRRTYDHFFSAVERLIPNARVLHAHMDYERTLISSFAHSYNLAEKHGCFAHFSRALYRRVQKLGLIRRYKEEGIFTILFDMIKSLVYVPPDDVRRAFDAIITHCAHNADGSERFLHESSENRFINYFVKTWLGPLGARPMFPVNLWNCFALTIDGKSKTTNSLEAWHNSLKLALATTDGKRPLFWKWLRKMKQECGLMEAGIVLLQSTPKKLRLEDQRIARQRTVIAKAYNRDRIFEYVRNQSDLTLLDQF